MLKSHAFRKRMEDETRSRRQAPCELKTVHGGLVDVEFFVQANILKYAGQWPRSSDATHWKPCPHCVTRPCRLRNRFTIWIRDIVFLSISKTSTDHGAPQHRHDASWWREHSKTGAADGYTDSGGISDQRLFPDNRSIRKIYNSIFHVESRVRHYLK